MLMMCSANATEISRINHQQFFYIILINNNFFHPFFLFILTLLAPLLLFINIIIVEGKSPSQLIGWSTMMTLTLITV